MKGFLTLCICAVNVALQVFYGAQVVVKSRIYIVQGRTGASATKGIQWLDTSTMFKTSEANWVYEREDEGINELHSSACALYNPNGTSFFCFGGANPSNVGHKSDASSLSFNVETRKWRHIDFSTTEHPTPRYGHVMITIPNLGIGLLGGAEISGSGISNEFWVLNPLNVWEKLKTNEMPPVYRHTLSFINRGPSSKIISIGGKASADKLTSTRSVQVYDMALKMWKTRNVRYPIQERHSHSAAVWEKYIIIYGGANSDNTEIYSDICALNTETMEWSTLSSGEEKPGRYGHNAAIINELMYITFGESSSPIDDVLVFDLKLHKFIDDTAISDLKAGKNWLKFWMVGVAIGLFILLLLGGLICFLVIHKKNFCRGGEELKADKDNPEYQFPDCGIIELSIDSGLDQFSSFSNGSANKHMGIPEFTHTNSGQGLESDTGSK